MGLRDGGGMKGLVMPRWLWALAMSSTYSLTLHFQK